jgi:hypothetical protein
MACFQRNLFPTTTLLTDPRPWDADVTIANGQWLALSNAPETIPLHAPTEEDPYDHRQLFTCTLPYAQQVPVRALLWHTNHAGGPRYIMLLASVPGGGLVTNRSLQASIGPPTSPKGICLAKAQLLRTLDPEFIDVVPIPASGEAALAIHLVPYLDHIGALHEFIVSPTQAGQPVTLRTIVSDDGAFGTPAASSIAPGAHIRGRWPQSNGRLRAGSPELAAIDVAAPCPEAGVQFAIGEPGPPVTPFPKGLDAIRYERQAGDTDGSLGGNKGLYGVDAEYTVYIANSADDYIFAAAYLRARNIPYAFFGATDNTAEEPPFFRTQGGVPEIRSSTPGAESVQIKVFSVPPGGPFPYTFRVAVGGAAGLPVNLQIMWKGQ